MNCVEVLTNIDWHRFVRTQKENDIQTLITEEKRKGFFGKIFLIG